MARDRASRLAPVVDMAQRAERAAAVQLARAQGQLTQAEVKLGELERCLVDGGDLYASDATAKHAAWAQELREKYDFTPGNTAAILRREVGEVFKTVLEHAGVFKRDAAGREAFRRFIRSI